MIKINKQNVEADLKAYCQRWLSYLSEGNWDQACKLVSVPNNYGVSWCKNEITESVIDYFGKESAVEIHNMDISECTPELVECNDGSYLYGFYLPVNGQITDLTVEFEFGPIEITVFSATINDIHVL